MLSSPVYKRRHTQSFLVLVRASNLSFRRLMFSTKTSAIVDRGDPVWTISIIKKMMSKKTLVYLFYLFWCTYQVRLKVSLQYSASRDDWAKMHYYFTRSHGKKACLNNKWTCSTLLHKDSHTGITLSRQKVRTLHTCKESDTHYGSLYQGR